MSKIKVAVVGCGAIANGMHLPGLATMAEMGLVEVVAACDIVGAAARATCDRFNILGCYTDVEKMLAEVDSDLVVNCTRIPDHFGISLTALRAGRNVYTQKPMTTCVEEATVLIEEAKQRGLRLASAPEHPILPVFQTIRRLLDEGTIGRVAFAKVVSSHFGPEKHDVNRDSTWFYKAGSSPLLDMGVHGLSQITALLGPVKRLSCFSGQTSPIRYHTAGVYKGKAIDLEVDDNTILMLDFGQSTYTVLDATYCVAASRGPAIEIYGLEGTISVSREGIKTIARLYRAAGKDPADTVDPSRATTWETIDVPAAPPVRDQGVLHMIDSLLENRKLVLTGERGRHLVEIMATASVAAREGRTIDLTTTF